MAVHMFVNHAGQPYISLAGVYRPNTSATQKRTAEQVARRDRSKQTAANAGSPASPQGQSGKPNPSRPCQDGGQPIPKARHSASAAAGEAVQDALGQASDCCGEAAEDPDARPSSAAAAAEAVQDAPARTSHGCDEGQDARAASAAAAAAEAVKDAPASPSHIQEEPVEGPGSLSTLGSASWPATKRRRSARRPAAGAASREAAAACQRSLDAAAHGPATDSPSAAAGIAGFMPDPKAVLSASDAEDHLDITGLSPRCPVVSSPARWNHNPFASGNSDTTALLPATLQAPDDYDGDDESPSEDDEELDIMAEACAEELHLVLAASLPPAIPADNSVKPSEASPAGMAGSMDGPSSELAPSAIQLAGEPHSSDSFICNHCAGEPESNG